MTKILSKVKKQVVEGLFTEIINSCPEMINEIIASGYTNNLYDAINLGIQKSKTASNNKISADSTFLIAVLYSELLYNIFADEQYCIYDKNKQRLHANYNPDKFAKLFLKACRKVEMLTWEEGTIDLDSIMTFDSVILQTDLFPAYCFIFKLLKDQNIDLFYAQDAEFISKREIKLLKEKDTEKKTAETINTKELNPLDPGTQKKPDEIIKAYIHVYGDYPLGYL